MTPRMLLLGSVLLALPGCGGSGDEWLAAYQEARCDSVRLAAEVEAAQPRALVAALDRRRRAGARADSLGARDAARDAERRAQTKREVDRVLDEVHRLTRGHEDRYGHDPDAADALERRLAPLNRRVDALGQALRPVAGEGAPASAATERARREVDEARREVAAEDSAYAARFAERIGRTRTRLDSLETVRFDVQRSLTQGGLRDFRGRLAAIEMGSCPRPGR